MNDRKQTPSRFLTLRGAFGYLTTYCVLFALAASLFREWSWLNRGLLVVNLVVIPPGAISLRKLRPFAFVISLALLGGALLLALPMSQPPQPPRGGGSWPSCNNNLKQVALALHGYHEVHGQLPPAYIADEDGKPIHSWRALLFPYMELGGVLGSSELSYDFSKPWDAPENLEFLNRVDVSTYAPCHYCGANHNAGETMIVAVTGEGTAWPGPNSTTFDDVTDGMDSTICLVSIANSGIAWTEPRDLEAGSFTIADVATSSSQVSGDHGAGVYVARIDGSVGFLKETIDVSELHALCTIDAGDIVTREHFGQATKGVYSNHSHYDDEVTAGLLLAIMVLAAVIIIGRSKRQRPASYWQSWSWRR